MTRDTLTYSRGIGTGAVHVRVDRLAELRDRAAELELLERFDAIRSAAGHDYGSGQRRAELGRRRRELDVADRHHELKLDELTAAELEAAYNRVGRPRLWRLQREAYRLQTPATRRTVESWLKLQQRLERRVAIEAAESIRADYDRRRAERAGRGGVTE